MGSTIDDELPPVPRLPAAAACRDSDRLQVVAGADIDPATSARRSRRAGGSALL
ncbi:MAG: hypothetical protein R3E79_37715 [Caldilineaceae bacterium]